MALVNRPVFLQNVKAGVATFTNADSANTKKTLVTADADGTKVVAVLASSDDTSDRLGQLWITRSATSYLVGTTNVVTLAGTNGVADTANLLDVTLIPGLPVDRDGQVYLLLESGDTLQVSFTTQVTAAKTVYVVTQFANY